MGLGCRREERVMKGRERGISDGDAHEGMMKRGMKFCRCKWEVMVKERRKQGVKDEWSMNKRDGAEEEKSKRFDSWIKGGVIVDFVVWEVK